MAERAKAIANGEKTYFTGKPCKRGHVALRYSLRGRCVECERACSAAWKARNPEKSKASVVRGAPNDCWRWSGAYFRPSNESGPYGRFCARSTSTPAHRAAYRFANGAIAPGMVVRHTCDNPACCNPAHLVIGTHADNARDREERGRRSLYRPLRDTCVHGHALSGENLFIRSDGARGCRSCSNEKHRRYRLRKRGALNG